MAKKTINDQESDTFQPTASYSVRIGEEFVTVEALDTKDAEEKAKKVKDKK